MDEISLNLYCDEIKETKISDPLGKEKWVYMGLLIVPTHTEERLLKILLDKRCANGKPWGKCPRRCEYHPKNNKEVHYQAIKSMDEYFIAKRWIDFLMTDRVLTHFYILGINLSNIDHSRFGVDKPRKVFRPLYNRFFRTAIAKSVKSYFHRRQLINIHSIVHDNSDMESHEYFSWQPIKYLQSRDPKLVFHCDRIEFLDSNHKVSNDIRSHLIQYMDIILGAFFNALHWQSKDANKVQIAESICPLLDRLMNKPGNINSSYQYVGRQNIDFFPFRRKTLSDVARTWEFEFYKKREIRIERKTQPSLFD